MNNVISIAQPNGKPTQKKNKAKNKKKREIFSKQLKR